MSQLSQPMPPVQLAVLAHAVRAAARNLVGSGGGAAREEYRAAAAAYNTYVTTSPEMAEYNSAVVVFNAAVLAQRAARATARQAASNARQVAQARAAACGKCFATHAGEC